MNVNQILAKYSIGEWNLNYLKNFIFILNFSIPIKKLSINYYFLSTYYKNNIKIIYKNSKLLIVNFSIIHFYKTDYF